LTDKRALLREVFGYPDFRPGQEPLVDALLSGRDALGIMPTGAGKSVCYQLPALMQTGVTLVVSPLISLMRDQVNALVQMGIRGAYINSSLTENQCRKAIANACQGMYKIIYVAPERLGTPGIAALARSVDISMVCVDEAHCVSQWGQDFRPGYLKIPEFLDSLPRRPAVGAFTATATAQVREDIVRLLELNDPVRVVTGFDRQNLYFEVCQPQRKYDALRRYLSAHPDRSGIVYCLTRKTVEQVCGRLREDGFSAARYHAGLDPEERRRSQDDFLYDRCRVMVATNAFGMGIDKSNVGYVIHYNMPKDMESYYQEAGRAGRDGSPADCILLYSGQDVHTNQFLIEHGEENPELDEATRAELRRRELERLRRMTIYATTHDCLRGYFLRYFGEKPAGDCGNCSNCLHCREEVELTAEARSACLLVSRHNGRFGSRLLAEALRGGRGERVLRYRLNADEEYGALKHLSDQRTMALLSHLVERGYLLRSDGEYPTLSVGELARELMEGGASVSLSLPTEEAPARPKVQPAFSSADEALLADLKALRMELARKNGVPPFVVFSDATLREMAAQRPMGRHELLTVTGVGEVKCSRYGKAFLEVIARHRGR